MRINFAAVTRACSSWAVVELVARSPLAKGKTSRGRSSDHHCRVIRSTSASGTTPARTMVPISLAVRLRHMSVNRSSHMPRAVHGKIASDRQHQFTAPESRNPLLLSGRDRNAGMGVSIARARLLSHLDVSTPVAGHPVHRVLPQWPSGARFTGESDGGAEGKECGGHDLLRIATDRRDAEERRDGAQSVG